MPRTTYIHTTKAGFQEVRSRFDARALVLAGANLLTMALAGIGLAALIFFCLSGGA